MRIPSICLDEGLAKYLQQFRSCFSRPQYQYFETILLGLLLCEGGTRYRGYSGKWPLGRACPV